MTLAVPIRKRTWDLPADAPQWAKQLATDIGEMARDLNQYLGQLVPQRQLEFTAQYAEPMFVAFDHNPKGIVCMRIRQANNLEAVNLTGGMVHWRWEGARARIDSIDGMSPGSGLNYVFTFLMVG